MNIVLFSDLTKSGGEWVWGFVDGSGDCEHLMMGAGIISLFTHQPNLSK